MLVIFFCLFILVNWVLVSSSNITV